MDARQHTLKNKQLLNKKIDPIDEKKRVEVLRQQQNKKFSDIANLYIETKKRPEWTNPKSYQSWKNTLNTYASPILDNKPLIDINGKTMIAHVWEKAVLSKCGDVIVACCDKEAKDYLNRHNIPYVMTKKKAK